MPVERVETRTTVLFDRERPLALDSGATLAPVEVAYETYGTLDEARANAVVVCHALTGDAHAAGHHGDPARRGWWDNIIGPGRPLDTDRYFVICANLLGGCQGTTGPSSVDPATGRPYGLRFPLFTVRDLVRVPAGRRGPPRRRAAAGRDRRVARRHAGAAVGARRAGRARRGHRGLRQQPAVGPEHRLLGRRAHGHHGRPRLPRRRLLRGGGAARPGAGGRAPDGPHHLPVGRVDAPQVRAAPAERGRPAPRLRRRLPGRELPAAPGRVVPAPLRRQQLPLPVAGHGLLRAVRRPGRHRRRGRGR